MASTRLANPAERHRFIISELGRLGGEAIADLLDPCRDVVTEHELVRVAAAQYHHAGVNPGFPRPGAAAPARGHRPNPSGALPPPARPTRRDRDCRGHRRCRPELPLLGGVARTTSTEACSSTRSAPAGGPDPRSPRRAPGGGSRLRGGPGRPSSRSRPGRAPKWTRRQATDARGAVRAHDGRRSHRARRAHRPVFPAAQGCSHGCSAGGTNRPDDPSLRCTQRPVSRAVRRTRRRSTLASMASIEVADVTAAVVRDQAARAGLSVDAYIRRLALVESARQHASVLDEGFYEDAEAERLAG